MIDWGKGAQMILEQVLQIVKDLEGMRDEVGGFWLTMYNDMQYSLDDLIGSSIPLKVWVSAQTDTPIAPASMHGLRANMSLAARESLQSSPPLFDWREQNWCG